MVESPGHKIMAVPRGEKLCIINATIEGHHVSQTNFRVGTKFTCYMDQESTSKQTQQYSSCGKERGIIVRYVPEGLCQSLFYILGTFHGVPIFAMSTGVPFSASEGSWTAGGCVDIPSKYIIVGKLSYRKETRLLIKQALAKFRNWEVSVAWYAMQDCPCRSRGGGIIGGLWSVNISF